MVCQNISSTFEFIERAKVVTSGNGERVRRWTGVIAVRDLDIEPVSVQKLHQDGAGIGWGKAVKHAQSVKDGGHCGVVSRVDVHLPRD